VAKLDCLMNEQGLECLRKHAILQLVPARATLCAEGSEAATVHFLQTGTVRVFRQTENGRELHVGFRCAGSFLGLCEALSNWPLWTSAVCLTSCRVWQLPVSTLKRLLLTEQQLQYAVQLAQAAEVCQSIARLDEMATLCAKERLQQLLWDLTPKSGEMSEVGVLKGGLRLLDVAQIVGVSPEHLSRLLSELESEGIVRRHRSHIMLPDVQRLWHRISLPAGRPCAEDSISKRCQLSAAPPCK
jgi:CRP/FNR family transcriptional regulator, anaerobic regulatory protein